MNKKFVFVLFFTSMFFSLTYASESKFYDLDSTNDPNGCHVQISHQPTDFNGLSEGRSLWRVHDPKVEKHDQYNALQVHSCDVMCGHVSLLITKIEWDQSNEWKVRAMNAFLSQTTSPQRGYGTIYAWIPNEQEATEDNILNLKILERFGFVKSMNPLTTISQNVIANSGFIQLEASIQDIKKTLVTK